jgi:hypothetical protein
MFAEIFQASFVDSQSVVPNDVKKVFVVNNYLTTKKDDDFFPVIVTDDDYGVRAFPAVWDGSKYIKDKRWLMFGGRFVWCSNSAGYNFTHPAKLMDRYEGQ